MPSPIIPLQTFAMRLHFIVCVIACCVNVPCQVANQVFMKRARTELTGCHMLTIHTDDSHIGTDSMKLVYVYAPQFNVGAFAWPQVTRLACLMPVACLLATFAFARTCGHAGESLHTYFSPHTMSRFHSSSSHVFWNPKQTLLTTSIVPIAASTPNE
jgi:hypothetical protein